MTRFLLGGLLGAAAMLPAAAHYDLLIRNARVLDGAGNPWFRADIGVRGGKIAAVGSLAMLHCEDIGIIDCCCQMLRDDGHTHASYYARSRPVASRGGHYRGLP